MTDRESQDLDVEGSSAAETSSDEALLAALAHAPAITPDTALLGTRLGRYEIVALLGRGGMGVVYRANDTVLSREVALKLVPPDMLGDPERRARFVREARSAAAATHANIAAVYDVGEVDGQVFLAMELVEGETLRARLRGGALPPEDVLVIAKGIARGLAKAHEKGIIHRDLKPDNIIVGEALHVKLLDFGLAKLREAGHNAGSGTLTYDGRVLGTPAYMSPEQAKGREVDSRADLFSVGVILFELLVGVRPFRGDSAIEILSAVVRDEPPPLPETVPVVFAPIIKRCLEKSLDARYASAKELVADLDRIRRDESERVIGADLEDSDMGVGSTPPATTGAVRGSMPVEKARSLPPAAPPRRSSRWWLSAAAASLAIVAAVVIAKSKSSPPAALATPSPSSRASSRGVAVTDHPRPPSNNSAALAAYASALQNFRDGSIAFAVQELERASIADPGLAAAHLRILVITAFKMDTTKAREHFAAALQHRASLEPRDADVLAACEELIRERPNHAVLAKAIGAVHDKYPDDAEIAWVTSTLYGLTGRIAEARDLARRARELDPEFAAALWYEASLISDGDRADDAVKLLDECLRLSPSAASCLRIRSGIRAARGDCRGFEADARRMTEIEPRGPRAYEYLAAALAARGAPLESVRASLDKRATLAPSAAASSELRAQADLWVALLGGDLITAESAALTLAKIYDGDSSESAHVVPALALMDIYEERGEPERALGVAESFVRRLPAWTENAPGGVRARLVAARLRAGLIDESKAQIERAALLRESLEQATDPTLLPRTELYYWLDIEAQYVAGKSDAERALTTLDRLAADAGAQVPGFDNWARGKVELLGGRTSAAVKTLAAALSTCTAMPTTDAVFSRVPFSWMEAQLLLGEALEEKDHDRACAAYASVMDRWKDPKPRSVSVERARSRSKAKGCART